MKKVIANTLKVVAGVDIDVTIRGEKSFTFSYEGKNDLASRKIQDYFKNNTLEVDYDEECDYTCIYMDL